MMMVMIMSMHDGRADRCSHFRCRTTYTHACIYIYEKHTHMHAYLSIWEEFNVQFQVGIHFFNSFSGIVL